MTAPLWTGAALAAAIGGRPHGQVPAAVTGLSIDTRSLQPGDAFFAIKGERFDGHDFLTAAAGAGASLMVVAERKLPALGKVTVPLLLVDDVLKALERLGAAARQRSRARIIAVTGSVGKTTTKEALRHALGASGEVHASSASFNNHWGVPLSLARLPESARFAVFEIGMNHPGEIRPLVKLVRPHVAIVTLIAPAHLGFFRDLDEIAAAKGEIFEGVVPGGAAIVNADDPHGATLARIAREAGVTRIATFGEVAGADYRLTGFTPAGEGAFVAARIGGSEVEMHLAVPGSHIAKNVLAVLGAVDLVGADVAAAAAALSSWRAGKGRGVRHLIETGAEPIVVIDESYNANPASMRAALAVLGTTEPRGSGRRIAILGDMLELGSHSRRLHAELADPITEAGADAVFLVGEEMKALDDVLAERLHCQWHRSTGELQSSVLHYVRPGDVLMIKASNSIGFAKVVDALLKSGRAAPGDGPDGAAAGTASSGDA